MTRLLLSKQINDYCERYTTAEQPVLAALNRETNLKRADATMLSGHIQGVTLQMLSHMIRPSAILEIGTFTGYSAICLAQGLAENGILHTIDINEELHDIAAAYIAKAGYSNKIVQHIGDAKKVIDNIPGGFDLVFIDADKTGYMQYYDLVFDRIPIGGYIIADNVLYDGEVVLPEEEQSRNARAMNLFNARVHQDVRVEHVLFPVRDGLMLIRKTAN